MGAMPGNRKERRSNRVKGLDEVPEHLQTGEAERRDFFRGEKSEMRKFSTGAARLANRRGDEPVLFKLISEDNGSFNC